MSLQPPPIRSILSNPDGTAAWPWVKWWQSAQLAINTPSGKALSVTQATLPGGLTVKDTGLLVYLSDFNHLLVWNGANWTWAPGELGSDYVQPFLSAPNQTGWHLCDGSIVDRLNPDGTVTAVTLPNLTTAAYLKLGITSAAGPNAAAGESEAVSAGTPGGDVSQPAFTGSEVNSSNNSAGTPAGTISAPAATVGTPSTTIAVQSGAGSTVAALDHVHTVTDSAPTFTGTALPGHQHTITATGTVAKPAFTGALLPTHQHGAGTLDLINTQMKAFYRQ